MSDYGFSVGFYIPALGELKIPLGEEHDFYIEIVKVSKKCVFVKMKNGKIKKYRVNQSVWGEECAMFFPLMPAGHPHHDTREFGKTTGKRLYKGDTNTCCIMLNNGQHISNENAKEIAERSLYH
tara:strand:- start:256 stop:627 length:372 start_codon:yes stop_codon:yes gene_type:complete